MVHTDTSLQSLHSVSFTGACLAVSENADIMTFECTLHHTLHLAEDTLLIFVVVEDFVKLKSLSRSLSIGRMMLNDVQIAWLRKLDSVFKPWNSLFTTRCCLF